MNQEDRLLEHFNEGKSITRLSALVDLGIFELSSRIIALQKRGYDFNKKRTEVTNRYGEKCSVVKYSLKEDKNDVE